MAFDDYCEHGTGTSDPDDTVIVSVDSNLPAVGPTDPALDKALGRPVLLANLPGPQGSSQTAIGVCGDYGLGFGPIENRYAIQINTFEAYTTGGGGIQCLEGPVSYPDANGPSPYGTPVLYSSQITEDEHWSVLATSCLLGCDYDIDDQTESSEVLLALVDNHFWMVKVTHGALVSISTKPCNCCDISGQILEATLSGDNIPTTVVRLLPTRGSNYWSGSAEIICSDGDDPVYVPVTLACSGPPTATTTQPSEWTMTVCGLTLAITEATCDDNGTGFKVVASGGENMTCCDSSISATVVATGDTISVECFEETLGDTVVAEACGMPDLQEGDYVLMVQPPQDKTGTGSGTGSGDDIEWFIITACADSKSCDSPCDPPPPPPGPPCCGIDCVDWADTLTAVVEFTADDCGTCSTDVPLIKDGCDGASVVHVAEADGTCNGVDGAFNVGRLNLACATADDECGTEANPKPGLYGLSSDTLGEFTLNGDTACCDPLFLEFTLEGVEICNPFGMGSPLGNVTVTIMG